MILLQIYAFLSLERKFKHDKIELKHKKLIVPASTMHPATGSFCFYDNFQYDLIKAEIRYKEIKMLKLFRNSSCLRFINKKEL